MTDDPAIQEAELKRRRRNAVRTAWVLGAIATAVFSAFFMSGVIGRGL